jgi:hypothetical protein
MRNYPRNSPQAAARIVALTLLADGHLSKAELDALERLDAPRVLGLERGELETVLQTFCEDLLSAAHLTWADTCRIEPDTLAELMAEVDDPALRQRLLRLCLAIIDADDLVADGEAIVLDAALTHWGLRPEDILATRHHDRSRPCTV